jgi:hypothetical protein
MRDLRFLIVDNADRRLNLPGMSSQVDHNIPSTRHGRADNSRRLAIVPPKHVNCPPDR